MQPESTAHLLALAASFDADFNPANPPIIFERGEGALLYDTKGNASIDLSDIIANIGHCHPRHVAELRQAATQLITGKGSLTNPPRAELVAKLASITPSNLEKVFLATSGGEICDWSFRIARRANGKHEIMSFWGGVYGRTYGAMSLNGLTRRKRGFGPLMPGVIYAPYPDCYRCPFGKQPDTCNYYCIDFLDKVVDAESTGDLAALIIEPYLGVGGIIFPPLGYLPRLAKWAAERGVIFILDEIQSSFGRTGKMFALEWEDLAPNLLCLGKGLGGGLSIAALVAEAEIMASLQPGELSGGNGGNYLACSSALSVLSILEGENLPEQARQIGDYLLERMHAWENKFSQIANVRGRGLCLALEFVKDHQTKEPLADVMEPISQFCYTHGVYLPGKGSLLDLRPPLVLTHKQAEQAANVIEMALETVL